MVRIGNVFMYIITFYTKRFKPVYGFVLSVVIAMILGYTVENTDIFCWMKLLILSIFLFRICYFNRRHNEMVGK